MQVGLKGTVERLSGGLDAPVAEMGENFSQGQRQLICLARVLLRKRKVVLMDEASSSLDFESDEALQRAIKTSFADATIITIAHRLNSIISCDRVLVLDNGKVRAWRVLCVCVCVCVRVRMSVNVLVLDE